MDHHSKTGSDQTWHERAVWSLETESLDCYTGLDQWQWGMRHATKFAGITLLWPVYLNITWDFSIRHRLLAHVTDGGWEFPSFLWGHWQFPCTALTAGNLPAVRLCNETVKESTKDLDCSFELSDKRMLSQYRISHETHLILKSREICSNLFPSCQIPMMFI